MSDTQAKATPIDLEGMSDEQCRKILDAIETARTLGFRDGHSSARRDAVNSHDKLLEALKAIRDNGMDAKMCQITAKNALEPLESGA